MDSSGNLYIADSANSVVRKVNNSGKISTYAGNGTATYSGDGAQAIHASLNRPAALALDSAGNLYIADTFNNVIRKVDTGGAITTVVGSGLAGFSVDGTVATSASLITPEGVFVDSAGTIYVSDTGNNLVRAVK